MRQYHRWIASAVGAGSVLAFAGGTASAQSQELVVDPATAAGGDTIDVSGTCGPDGANADISIGLGGGIEGGIVAADVPTGATGDFSASFSLPADSPTGDAEVFATCGLGGDRTPTAALRIVQVSGETDETPDTTVTLGSTGRLVAYWQDRLNDWLTLTNHDTSLAVDGIFGPRTETATLTFQNATQNIQADAIVNPEDRVALHNAIETLETDETPDTTVTLGSTGRLVAYWQDRLNDWLTLTNHDTSLAVDGIFGPRTETATLTFQNATQNIQADAIVNPEDRVALHNAIETLETDETPDTTVTLGSTGRLVAYWQDRLNDWLTLTNHDTSLAVDGIFGPRTETATLTFQNATQNIQADAIVNPEDRVALHNAIETLETEAPLT